MTVATASCALTPTSQLPALPAEAEACVAHAMQAVSFYMPIVI